MRQDHTRRLRVLEEAQEAASIAETLAEMHPRLLAIAVDDHLSLDELTEAVGDALRRINQVGTERYLDEVAYELNVPPDEFRATIEAEVRKAESA